MNAIARARQLRQRAHDLRRLAEAVEASPVMHLDQHADVDTWRGTRPDLCRVTLAANQQQLHATADDLRGHAYRFEQQARELEAIAQKQIGLAG